MHRSVRPSVWREPATRASRPGLPTLVIDAMGIRVVPSGQTPAQVASRSRGTGAQVDATAVPA